VAYGSVLGDRRRALHGRIVDATERLYAGRIAGHVDRLAHHARQAERWASAVRYQHEAGVKALAQSAYRPAIGYFEQALEGLSHLDETRERLEQAIDVRFELRRALGGINEGARILSRLTEAEQIAHRLDDRRRLAWVYAYRANIFAISGAAREGVDLGARAVAIAEALGDVTLRVAAGVAISQACYHLGDLSRSVEVAQSTLERLPIEREFDTFQMTGLAAVNTRQALAIALAELGRFDEAMSHARDALRIAERADHTYSRLIGAAASVFVLLRRGDFAAAIEITEGMRTLSAATGAIVPALASVPGRARVLAGRPEGPAMVEQAYEAETASGVHRLATIRALVEARLLERRWSDAEARCDRWLRDCHEAGHRTWEAWALFLGAEAMRGGGRPAADVEARYRAALTLAEEIGMRPLAARTLLRTGQVLTARGAFDEARAVLGRAASMLREMNMVPWILAADDEITKLPR
jgi:tetratricopeptide (TPR) repeat protein